MELQKSLRPLTFSMAVGGFYFTPRETTPATSPSGRGRVVQIVDRVRRGSRLYCALILAVMWLNLIRCLVAFQDGIEELIVTRVAYSIWFLQCVLNATVMFHACQDPKQLQEFFALWKIFEDNSRNILCAGTSSADETLVKGASSEKFSSTTSSAYSNSNSVSPGFSPKNVFKKIFSVCRLSRKGGKKSNGNGGCSIASLVVTSFGVAFNAIACGVLMFVQLDTTPIMTYSSTAPFPDILFTQIVFFVVIVFSSFAWLLPVAFLWNITSFLTYMFSRVEQAVQVTCLPSEESFSNGDRQRDALGKDRARTEIQNTDNNSDLMIQEADEIEEMDTIAARKEENHFARNTLQSDASQGPAGKIFTLSGNVTLAKPPTADLYANDGYVESPKAAKPGQVSTAAAVGKKSPRPGDRIRRVQPKVSSPPLTVLPTLQQTQPKTPTPAMLSDDPKPILGKGNERFTTTEKRPLDASDQEEARPLRTLGYSKHCLMISEVRRFPANLECLRRLHIQLCTSVSMLDRTFSRLIMACYSTSIPLVCFLAYRMINDKQLDAFFLSVMGYWCAQALGSVIVISIGCARNHEAAHSPLDHLYHLDVSIATQVQRDQLQLFMSKLCGPPVGFTALTILTVTKEMLLTLGGLLVTYFFLLLQFNI